MMLTHSRPIPYFVSQGMVILRFKEKQPRNSRPTMHSHRSTSLAMGSLPPLCCLFYTREVIPVAWDGSEKTIPDPHGETLRARGTSVQCESSQEAAFTHALCLEVFAFNGRRDGSGEGGVETRRHGVSPFRATSWTQRRQCGRLGPVPSLLALWSPRLPLRSCDAPLRSPSLVRSSHPKIVLSLLL